jgi:uncharacterized protein YukJ
MLSNYGLLKAKVKIDNGEYTSRSGMTHYNLIATPNGGEDYQVNIDVQSNPRQANMRVLYMNNYERYNGTLTAQLDALSDGKQLLDSQPDGLSLDYIRENLFDKSRLRNANPTNAKGIGKLLDKYLSDHQNVIIFGTFYDDQQDTGNVRRTFGLIRRDARPDLPPRGIHNVHYNQGSTGRHADANGIYQDGALFIKLPDGSYTVFFFAFSEQCFCVDEQGNCDCGS